MTDDQIAKELVASAKLLVGGADGQVYKIPAKMTDDGLKINQSKLKAAIKSFSVEADLLRVITDAAGKLDEDNHGEVRSDEVLIEPSIEFNEKTGMAEVGLWVRIQ